MSTVAYDDEVMLRDVMPAEVYRVGGEVMTKVRAFVTNRRLIVWGLDKDGPVKRLDVELSEPPGAFASRSTLALDESLELATLTQGYIVNRGRGCGCGGAMMRLKALGAPAPWKG